MNKPFHTRRLGGGVVVDFFDQNNRYFGDFHRLKINAIATISFDTATLPADLQEFAASYSGNIKYKKSLERMGVVTSLVEIVTHELIVDFIETVENYLKKKNFAENLLRRELQNKTKRSTYYQ